MPTAVLDDTITHFGGFFSSFTVSWLLNFTELRCVLAFCINNVDIGNYCIIFRSAMPKPVYLLTVQEAHKEYNSLTDQIWAKYEHFDSDEFGAVSTPSFNAEACKLDNLLACVSQLCQRLNLPTSKELYRPTSFKH